MWGSCLYFAVFILSVCGSVLVSVGVSVGGSAFVSLVGCFVFYPGLFGSLSICVGLSLRVCCSVCVSVSVFWSGCFVCLWRCLGVCGCFYMWECVRLSSRLFCLLSGSVWLSVCLCGSVSPALELSLCVSVYVGWPGVGEVGAGFWGGRRGRC